MEERLEKLQKMYKEISDEMESWMREDMKKDARPGAYSIDKSMMYMRTSFMWLQDAAAQVLHYENEVAPKMKDGEKL